jgi:hypothetical protein
VILDQTQNNNNTVLTALDSHAVFFVVVHAVLTPAAHVEASAQAVHGALPEAENVLPASHGKG